MKYVNELYALAGFDPNQPRNSAGEWSSTGGLAGSISSEQKTISRKINHQKVEELYKVETITRFDEHQWMMHAQMAYFHDPDMADPTWVQVGGIVRYGDKYFSRMPQFGLYEVIPITDLSRDQLASVRRSRQ